jgi:hypothetical protein
MHGMLAKIPLKPVIVNDLAELRVKLIEAPKAHPSDEQKQDQENQKRDEQPRR